MTDLVSIFRDFTPGAYGIWSGVMMFAAWWAREWRETRKLSADDRMARREGYAKQVEMLMGENRSLHSDLATLRSEYDRYRDLCHRENDQLRTMVIKLENDLEAVRRNIADGAIRAIKAVRG